ncbi:MAG: winged helix-turn-helix domain-containing protein [Candidatus Woesearchaeota archaeon]
MGKGSTQILIRRIIESLAKSPKSSSEIARETGLDRTAISRYLEVLNKSGFVTVEKKGSSKRFILSSNYRIDTYFGLSLDSKTDRLIDSIYYYISERWKENSSRRLLKTTAQKIMYQIIHDCDLSIPNGWYIYGGICVKPYDANSSYGHRRLSQSIINCVNETVTEYSKNKFEYESKQLQYKKAGKELYYIKEDILKILYSKSFTKKSMHVLQKQYARLRKIVPSGDALYYEIINDYDTLLIDITREWDHFVDEKDDRNYAEFKHKLVSSFEALWKMIAMQNFKEDLLLGGYYMEKELYEHFRLDIAQAKEDVIEICSLLNEMIPSEEPDDPDYDEFKRIIKEGHKLPKKEQARLIEKLNSKIRRKS